MIECEYEKDIKNDELKLIELSILNTNEKLISQLKTTFQLEGELFGLNLVLKATEHSNDYLNNISALVSFKFLESKHYENLKNPFLKISSWDKSQEWRLEPIRFQKLDEQNKMAYWDSQYFSLIENEKKDNIENKDLDFLKLIEKMKENQGDSDHPEKNKLIAIKEDVADDLFKDFLFPYKNNTKLLNSFDKNMDFLNFKNSNFFTMKIPYEFISLELFEENENGTVEKKGHAKISVLDLCDQRIHLIFIKKIEKNNEKIVGNILFKPIFIKNNLNKEVLTKENIANLINTFSTINYDNYNNDNSSRLYSDLKIFADQEKETNRMIKESIATNKKIYTLELKIQKIFNFRDLLQNTIEKKDNFTFSLRIANQTQNLDFEYEIEQVSELRKAFPKVINQMIEQKINEYFFLKDGKMILFCLCPNEKEIIKVTQDGDQKALFFVNCSEFDTFVVKIIKKGQLLFFYQDFIRGLNMGDEGIKYLPIQITNQNIKLKLTKFYCSNIFLKFEFKKIFDYDYELERFVNGSFSLIHLKDFDIKNQFRNNNYGSFNSYIS